MMSDTSTVKGILPLTRVVFLLSAVLAFIAGIQLYILTDNTDHYFAWTIAAPLSATFLGAGYWTGAVLLLFAIREQAWSNIRIAVAAVAPFVPMMLITTLLHLDRFHFNSTDANAQIAAWAWMIVYVAVPLPLLVIVYLQLRTPGGDAPKHNPIALLIRILIGVNAVISLALAVSLFFFPQTLVPVWPWPLTPLTARTIGAGFFSVAAASMQLIRENDWKRGRIGTVSYLLIGALQLIALMRYPGTVDWSRPGTWLYIVFMVGILCGGIYSTVVAWDLLGQKKPMADTVGVG